MPATDRVRVHTLAFEDPDRTLDAVRTLKRDGFEVHDVHTPYAVHGMDEALGLRETRLGTATFAGGLAGAALAFGFQIWTHAIDWPLTIGGKSPLALPAQVPVSFELTVLFAAFATVGGLLARRRLFPRLAKVPAAQPDVRVTDDRFVVVVVERDGRFRRSRFLELARLLGSVETVESWRVR
jgi:ActD protein